MAHLKFRIHIDSENPQGHRNGTLAMSLIRSWYFFSGWTLPNSPSLCKLLFILSFLPCKVRLSSTTGLACFIFSGVLASRIALRCMARWYSVSYSNNKCRIEYKQLGYDEVFQLYIFAFKVPALVKQHSPESQKVSLLAETGSHLLWVSWC